MSKRLFRRKVKAEADASYPTLEQVDSDRRAFLARLGGLLGASALAGLATACGDRAVKGRDGGGPKPPDIGLSGAPDAAVLPDLSGVPPLPDAEIDPQPLDGGYYSDGVAPVPDAEIDTLQWPDIGMGGVAPEPDAAIDQDPDYGGPAGVPPLPDAAADGGECPNP